MNTPADAPKDRILLGAIIGARGLKGDVRVKSFTGRPEAIGDYGPLGDVSGTRTFDLTVTSAGKDQVFARVAGVTNRDQAEALKGTQLFVDRAVLPEPDEDEYYFADLIGLRAEDPSGLALGTVTGVQDHGAGAFLELSGPEGQPGLMVSFTGATVPLVDLAGGRLVVVLPDEVVVPPDGKDPDGTEEK